MSRSLRMIIAILAILALAAVVSGIKVWHSTFNKIPLPSTSQKINGSGGAAYDAHIPADWKSYRNETFRFELAYPDSFQVATIPPLRTTSILDLQIKDPRTGQLFYLDIRPKDKETITVPFLEYVPESVTTITQLQKQFHENVKKDNEWMTTAEGDEN